MPIICDHKGIYEGCVGDRIHATFGSTLEDDPALGTLNAIRTAQAMVKAVQAWNTRRAVNNKAEVKLALGISNDTVLLGFTGPSFRQQHTAIGAGVDAAIKLCIASVSTSRDNDVLIDGNCVAFVKNVFVCEMLESGVYRVK